MISTLHHTTSASSLGGGGGGGGGMGDTCILEFLLGTLGVYIGPLEGGGRGGMGGYSVSIIDIWTPLRPCLKV